ncbi:MAG: autotransporter strand-loop-strand O-heptosyltransferase [Pararobbsia sp.]
MQTEAISSSSAAVPTEPAPTPAYPPPAPVPTQLGPGGLRFDFNDGCRVTLPPGNWRVCLRDHDTGNVLFETAIATGYVASTKKYFVRFEVLVWARTALARQSDAPPLLHHVYDAADRNVLVQLPVGTLGDTIGWLPYAVAFQRRHRCRLTCAMAPTLIPLFKDAYPEIAFVSHEQVQPQQYYATYSIGLFFDDEDCVRQPSDFRLVGLHRTAGYILGVDPREAPPRLALPDDSRPIEAPYVCIAVQSSTQSKYWNNPGRLARRDRVHQGRGLPGGLHRPEANARHRHDVEPTFPHGCR